MKEVLMRLALDVGRIVVLLFLCWMVYLMTRVYHGRRKSRRRFKIWREAQEQKRHLEQQNEHAL